MLLPKLLLSMVFLMSGTPDNEMSLPVLISEKLESNDDYLIVCRGFPQRGLTGIQAESSAREAALINAQTFASARFSGIDPIKLGEARKYQIDENGAIIEYVIHYPNIKKYLKNKTID